MNVLEQQQLIGSLQRRGGHVVRADTLSCTVDEYRAAVRAIARKLDWRVRTLTVNDSSSVIVIWTDRGQTDLEKRAASIAIRTGREYDEVLEEQRRGNLRIVSEA